MRVEFHPDAETDAEEARRWYAERSAIAARISHGNDRFRRPCIAIAGNLAALLAGTRRYVFPRFPFSLVYRLANDVMTVVAVAHHRRKPGYWVERH